MKKLELDDNEIKVLETLAEHGAMSPGQVSAETWILPNDTQNALKVLHNEGLVLMRNDTQSPDGKLVAITIKARELMQARTLLRKKG